MRRLVLAACIALAVVPSTATAQAFGDLGAGWGQLGATDDCGAALTLPDSPQYYLAAPLDFARGASNADEIGDVWDICPSGDSATTSCLGQAFPTRRGNFASAANCKSSVECWQWATSDRSQGQAGTTSPSDWTWFGGEPFVIHVGLAWTSTLTGIGSIVGNRSSSSGLAGTYILADMRTSKRDLLIRVGGTSETTYVATGCMTGVVETAPIIVSLVMRSATGTGALEAYVNGTSCGAVTPLGYSQAATNYFSVHGLDNQAAGEGYFVWADTETTGGTVAAMEARGDQALAFFAAQYGVTLP